MSKKVIIASLNIKEEFHSYWERFNLYLSFVTDLWIYYFCFFYEYFCYGKVYRRSFVKETKQICFCIDFKCNIFSKISWYLYFYRRYSLQWLLLSFHKKKYNLHNAICFLMPWKMKFQTVYVKSVCCVYENFYMFT